MKILVVSDTHRSLHYFLDALEQEENVDLVIHCGDVEGQEEELIAVVQQAYSCEIVMVAGNNDFFSSLDQDVMLSLEGFSIMVSHGHHYYVSLGTDIIRDEANSRGCDIVCFGHIHRPVVEDDKKVLVINPGSITYPRQEGKRPSYVVLTIEEGKRPFAEVKYL